MKPAIRPLFAVRAAATAAALAVVLAGATALSCATSPEKRLSVEWYDLGNAYFDLGKYEKAVAAYRRALALDPGLAAATYNQARALVEMGKTAEALALLDGLLEAEPGNFLFISAKAYALWKSGDLEGAKRAYRRAAELAPFDTLVWYNLAVLDYESGDFEAALERAKAVVANDEANPSALLLVARCERGLGLREDAITHLEAYLSRVPADARAWKDVAALYAETKRYAKAMEAWAKAVALEPGDAVAWFELAFLRLTVAADGKGGLEALRKALDAGFADKERAAALVSNPSLVEKDAVYEALRAKGLVE